MTCPCEMTAAELLAANTASRGDTLKSILIEDRGGRWHVTPYAACAAGLGSEHSTIQSAMEDAERWMVRLRRDETPPMTPGEVVTDPAEIVAALLGPAKRAR